jgi:hypothetical protein
MMTTSLFFISTAFLLKKLSIAASTVQLKAQPQGLPSNASATQIAELDNCGPASDPSLNGCNSNARAKPTSCKATSFQLGYWKSGVES